MKTNETPATDIFDSISPIDYRYAEKELLPYLSENAFIQYKLKVEVALVKQLVRKQFCPAKALSEVEAAAAKVTTAEVYAEEKRVGHDIRALVNCIRNRVSKKAKPFIHMTATSFDISDTANALRYRDAVKKALLWQLIRLDQTLIDLALREAETLQVGRTHGQHAVPITFGFAMAGYVSRLGQSIKRLDKLAEELPGKFSGAVGAYNASNLFFQYPAKFEKDLLEILGIEPAEHSTQIVPPEPLIRLMSEVVIAAGIMANLARDMRHLQRTEIGEVGEEFDAKQVGSSTMPQKRNPINFENVESLWKLLVPRLCTLYLDQLSEHQRDLTNSASARAYGEIIAYTFSMAKRLQKTMNKLKVDRGNLKRNLEMSQGLIVAEPLYIVLAAIGHPDAHEAVRRLTLQAQADNRPLQLIVKEDPQLKRYLKKMSREQLEILNDPEKYVGIAAGKATAISQFWKNILPVYLVKNGYQEPGK